jgi:hypothetical protein
MQEESHVTETSPEEQKVGDFNVDRKRKAKTSEGQSQPTTLMKVQQKSKAETKPEAKTNDDPFIGKPVAFSSISDFAKALKKECGKRWSAKKFLLLGP